MKLSLGLNWIKSSRDVTELNVCRSRRCHAFGTWIGWIAKTFDYINRITKCFRFWSTRGGSFRSTHLSIGAVAGLVRLSYGALARRLTDYLLQEVLSGSSDGGAMTAEKEMEWSNVIEGEQSGRKREGGKQRNSAFVADTDFGSHSMTHQTLISSAPAAAAFSSAPHLLHASLPTLSPSSSPAASAMSSSSFAHHHGSLQVERMSALRSSLRPCEAAEEAHDAEELEWVSRIMDDSQAELPPPAQLPAPAAWPPQHRRPQESAVPAVDPMRTPTICALSTEALVPVRSKKRSKRSRGTTVWSLSGASISDSASSSATSSSCSSSASLSSFFLMDSPTFNLLDEPPRTKSKNKKSKHKLKKRGRKPKSHLPPQLSGGAASPPAQGDRRCSHCGVQKTPQWRAGPEGAKTLCNACGVRFKSGRLLPEYRPACSPTFVGNLHSNSHRKVLEMRRKKDPVPVAIEAAAAPAVASF
ncbi:unnamed protein product [Triticum turgidum subsp. durum]|uniref:GATA-type domain-containing protein n=1 Tax=Triticum turgidum subsp. durum TaxID=4567 RepID=A0A9R0Y2D2_TRITD|nr:unnamed protein product [Triticum turgidum subsp. durum]